MVPVRLCQIIFDNYFKTSAWYYVKLNRDYTKNGCQIVSRQICHEYRHVNFGPEVRSSRSAVDLLLPGLTLVALRFYDRIKVVRFIVVSVYEKTEHRQDIISNFIISAAGFRH